MDVENVKSDFVVVKNGTVDHNKGNGTVPDFSEAITFGSHGPKETVDGFGTHLPKDAVDEWPAPPQLHSFWLPRYRSYDDPKMKARLDAADKDLRNKADARSQIIEKIQAIRSKRFEISAKVGPLSDENNKFKSIMDGKKKEMEPVNQALSQLRPNNSNREKGAAPICSSEEDLNRLIKSLQYRISHESIPLTEEKQILREIKQLEGTRPKVVENAAERAKILDSLGSKVDLQDQYKLMGDGLSGVKKERQVVTAQLKQLLEERSAVDKDIKKLEEELKSATEKRDKAKEAFQELWKKRDEGNAGFYKYRMLLNKAKTIANSKDVAALEEFTNSEVETFMKMWNGNKSFRDDYEKRVRGPDVVPEPSPKPEQNTSLKLKQTKNDSVSALQNGVVPTDKIQKESKSKVVKEARSILSEPVDSDNKEKITETDKPKKVEKKVDEAKLKEIRREEEIAKAKQALERKKKLAEKAAAKAATKAQREAEKKEKDREKKLKKKASASGQVPEPEEQSTEAEGEVAELEKAIEAIEEPVKSKIKGRKESVMRNRTRSKGTDQMSKAIFKRKKSMNYWVWAAPAAVSVMMVFVIGYKYLI